jgi:hypothetical protein
MPGNPNLSPELLEAKKFHGHLGPYLVIGMRMGGIFCATWGDRPFGFRIHTTAGWKPPPSCILDGLQISTPCTIGNSMLKVQEGDSLQSWAEKDGIRLEITLLPDVRTRIDRQTTRENEESFAQELWQAPAENLFEIRRTAVDSAGNSA